MASKRTFPGCSDEANPEIFNVAPPYSGEKKPGQFTDEQRKEFFEEGFVVVEDYVPKDLLDAIRIDIVSLVDEVAKKLYDAGKISSMYKEEGLFTRMIRLEKEFPGANVVWFKHMRLTPNMEKLWALDKFLNLSEQLLGTREIMGHPVWNLRPKTPKNHVTNVPWHQDVAYLDNDSYNVMHVSAWIPLLDTNEANGCMQMMRRGHKTGKVAPHQGCYENTWYVMLGEDEMAKTLDIDVENDLVTCPVPYGGAVIFNNLIPHRSLNNVTDTTRWTFDFRWMRDDKPVGFFGVKDAIKLSSADPDFKINWDPFNSVARQEATTKVLDKEYDEIDTTLFGPWMLKWETVHTNRHTEALEREQKKKAAADNP